MRTLLVAIAVTLSAGLAWADVYQWEYINPANPALGKQQSSVLCPGGAGANAAPNSFLGSRDLTKAYLIGANLTNATLTSATLTNADLSSSNLTSARLPSAKLSGATLAGADVRKADFSSLTAYGFTAAQLYSTASYQAHDLNGMKLWDNDMTGWNFAGFNHQMSSFIWLR